MAKRHTGDTVERRIRLHADTATRLAVAAAVRGSTESELIEQALLPYLCFTLPDLPGVRVMPLPGRGGG